ncbi:YeiH family protein [Rhodococcus chondri]|uniref:Sulfate exporter family transporter n=1 Tax=Rhodococcus chondri TaxID=3065941 RepID=A0ABU7JQE0_9NOCA|nr:putative sulfate exporter family transporter [Rhodococcus sp. CC-R104]MEE2032246.1 putative sulfate exporter family transporter [Rhodococcus sp. CC-R104]
MCRVLDATAAAESDRRDPDHDTSIGADTRPSAGVVTNHAESGDRGGEGSSGGRRTRLNRNVVLERVRASLPGSVLSAAAAATAVLTARLLGGISPLLIAILLGAVVANLRTLPAVFEPGVTLASRRLLRIGVALLGLQLLVPNVLALGWGTLAVVAGVVVLGIAGSMALGKWLGIGYTQRLLIACSFSICGAAAAAAVDGVVNARKRELVTTVALVVIFGTVMIPALPAAAAAMGLDSTQAGMWAGAAIHEVAQVVAAGGALDAGSSAAVAGGGALAIAVTVKLARVALLAPVVAWIGVVSRRRAVTPMQTRRPPLVPLFLVGFLACVALRATGVLGPAWLDAARLVQTAMLTSAMFALGTGVRLSVLRGVGWRPFALAAASTIVVTATSLTGVLLLT